MGNTNKRYIWTAECNDGAFQDKSAKGFATAKEAYEDMRNAALEKMKWNTEYDADFKDDADLIGYNVLFSKTRIIHESYSGKYTYEVKYLPDIMNTLNGHNAELVSKINDAFYDNRYSEDFAVILLALLTRDMDEYEKKFDEKPTLTKEYAMANAHTILEHICDDRDLSTILVFIRYKD